MRYLALLCVFVATTCFGQRSRGGNPFQPPTATVHYAPDRTFDLQKVYVELTVDYPKRSFAGFSRNELAPLRDGLSQIGLHAGDGLALESVQVDGKTATYKRDGTNLLISVPPTVRGKLMKVVTRYRGGGGSQRMGFHFIQPSVSDPNRVGFWTQGETAGNRDWVVTWDYPNDFTKTETRITVPATWTVIGNGVKVFDKANGSIRTVGWRMDQPHATYLLSLVGAPMDVKYDRYRDKQLIYAVPKGKGKTIAPSFGDTKEMLAFFESYTGTPYPWPKYAQNAMWEFGGGMENVSATTLGAGSLTDGRDDPFGMASLNSHELAHQWFGDLATCKDWGNTWLNESFATYMEALYLEHSRGKAAYERDMDGDMRGYIVESKRYKRPLATNLYRNPDAMFDQHAYPKGAAVLHTLRRIIGDKAFSAGLKLYFQRYSHTPVETWQLCQALTDASGVNCQPFFDQWVYKPGHPILEYSWTYDEAAKQVQLQIAQKQDTSDGTPIYDITAQVGLITNGKALYQTIRLDAASQTLPLPADVKPQAVLVDPNHDFLREISGPAFQPAEAEAVFLYAPNATDRAVALSNLVAAGPTDAQAKEIVDALHADRGRWPVFTDINQLGKLKREDWRPFFVDELSHPSYRRREQALIALSQMPADPATATRVKALIRPDVSYPELRGALRVLSAWDPVGNEDTFIQIAKLPIDNESVLSSVYEALAKTGRPEAVETLFKVASDGQPETARLAAIRQIGGVDGQKERVVTVYRRALQQGSYRIVLAVLTPIEQSKMVELLPELKAVAAKNPPGFLRDRVQQTIDELGGKA